MGGIADTRRVVVADDSRLMRRMLADALGRQGFDVVATAADGDEALAACRDHRPDAMTLDLHMPGLDGIGVLRALRAGRAAPVPVVVVSAFSPAHGARAVDALGEGAFELVAKPAFGEPLDLFASELGRKVGQAAHSGLVRRVGRPIARRPDHRRAAVTGRKLVVIACSTGGPKALGELIPRLPAPLGAGTLIVQHMPAGFTASLASRLDAVSPLTVREVAGGEPLQPGVALLAPGGAHLRLGDDRRARLSDEAPVGGLRPRADFTIEDARTAPPALLKKWFEPVDEGGWQAKAELVRMTRFEVGDLLRMPVQAGRYDLIMCRNTVIYFTEEVRDALHGRLATALAPGGYLVVGTSERVADPRALGLESPFHFIYRKS